MQESWTVGKTGTGAGAFKTGAKKSKGKGQPTPPVRALSEDVSSAGSKTDKTTTTRIVAGTESEESAPILRSLSMSRNLALSVVDEVPHMIRLSPNAATDVKKPTLKKSSSASSLSRLLLLSTAASASISMSMSNSTYDDYNQTSPSTNLSAGAVSVASPGGGAIDRDRDFGFKAASKKKNNQSSATAGGAGASSVPSSSLSSGAGGIINPGSAFEPEALADASIGIGKLELRSLADEASVKNLIGGKRNDLLVGVVVSRWDNIVGPQCVYLWTEERTSTFYPSNLSHRLSRLVKYVTDHTVDHHDVDGNLVLPSTLRSTLCIVRDLDLAYLSVSIRVPLDPENESSYGFSHLMDRNRPASTVPHSVAVLANLQYLSHFLLLRPLILNWLSEFSPKIGVLLCKSQLQSSMINSWCAELCKTMTALRTCWCQESHHCHVIKNTELISHGHGGHGHGHGSSSSSAMMSSMAGGETVEDPDDASPSSLDYLPPSSLNKTVLEALLASFLTTFGSAIVVGEDATAVNQVIRFLLCFAKDQEAYCSRYVLPTLPDTFMKGLLVQGLMLGEIGAKSISYNQVTSNRYPFTYIELSRKQVKVRQTNLQSHKSQREAILREELSALWNSSALGSSSTDPFQQVVKEGCGFLNRFLEELRLLRPERRYARLLLFKRSLHAKAIALIAYLESIREKPPKDRIKCLKPITTALGFDDAEYSIVQIAAEKIRPGIQSIIRSKQFYI